MAVEIPNCVVFAAFEKIMAASRSPEIFHRPTSVRARAAPDFHRRFDSALFLDFFCFAGYILSFRRRFAWSQP